MIHRFSSEQELLDSFRPSERAEVELPREVTFPLDVRDCHAWTQAAGFRTYLVVIEPGSGKTLGIVFKALAASSEAPAAMCEWCHSVRGGDGVTMLTATASSNRRVGVSVCRDLSCRSKILEDTPGTDDLHFGASPQERVRRMAEKMAGFARRNIF